MSGGRHWEQNKDATVYIGNLDERVNDSLVWELMLQAGRIVNVHLPKDRVTQTHQGYGFVEFISETDADYAAKIMNQVRLYGKMLRINKASADKQKAVDIGAELFVGNLDPMVNENMLYDTFSRFGGLVSLPKVARDDSQYSKGYAFLSFNSFSAADNAIENMHGKYLMNREISVQYAYKKDGRGLRHGDDAERRLAAEAQQHGIQVPVQQISASTFAAAPPQAPPVPQHQPPAGFGGGMPNGFDPRQQASDGMSVNASPFHAGSDSASAHTPGHQPAYTPYAPPPPPQHQNRPPMLHHASHPLPPAPTGLPARPPPSQAGYGGPAGFAPPMFGGQHPQGGPPPPGFPGPPPAGFPGPPAGSPPNMPPGFGGRR